MSLYEQGHQERWGDNPAGITLNRLSLAELLICDRDRLLASLEDTEIIVVRRACCPERPLRSFAERHEALLHQPDNGARRPAPEEYLIVGNPRVSMLAEYVRNERIWENDHVLGQAPGGVSIMAMPEEAPLAMSTEFACTAAAWDSLTPAEQDSLTPLRVLHGFWQDQLYHAREPRHEAMMQWMARNSAEFPLVQPLPYGRHALLLADSALQIADMNFSESEIRLDDLRTRVTGKSYTYRQIWQPGDLVIWNSASVMYRNLPRLDNPIWKIAQGRR